jgi:beta-galactosidase
VTVNRFGRGEAYYIAARMDDRFNDDFYGELIGRLNLKKAIDCVLPERCTAQLHSDGETDFVFLMNISPDPKRIEIGPGGRSLLSGERVSGEIALRPWGAEVYSK